MWVPTWVVHSASWDLWWAELSVVVSAVRTVVVSAAYSVGCSVDCVLVGNVYVCY